MGPEVGRLWADSGVMKDWDDMGLRAWGELSDKAIAERRGELCAFTELVGRHDRRLPTLAGRLLRNPGGGGSRLHRARQYLRVATGIRRTDVRVFPDLTPLVAALSSNAVHALSESVTLSPVAGDEA